MTQESAKKEVVFGKGLEGWVGLNFKDILGTKAPRKECGSLKGYGDAEKMGTKSNSFQLYSLVSWRTGN